MTESAQATQATGNGVTAPAALVAIGATVASLHTDETRECLEGTSQ